MEMMMTKHQWAELWKENSGTEKENSDWVLSWQN